MKCLHQNGSSKLALSLGGMQFVTKPTRQPSLTSSLQLAASAPTSRGGLNMIIAFGFVEGNACSTSDCIKAYVQSYLDSSCPTYVLLPVELLPAHAKHIHQPVAPLMRSLYGHPLASASWQNHLSTFLSNELGGIEVPEQPSCFHFPSMSLALSVYDRLC